MGSPLQFFRKPLLTRILSAAILSTLNLTPLVQVLAFGGTTPTIPNPSVFTDLVEQVKVDGASGAFTQKVQIDIPPGRSGLQPDVSLQYNSQNTSDGIVGYGWSLPIPFVQRLNKTGSQDFYNSIVTRYFTSSVDGELANVIDATATTAPATTSPSILDTLPVTYNTASAVTGTSFTYTVPPSSTNKLLVTRICLGGSRTPTLTQNGVTVPLSQIGGSSTRCYHWYGVLPNPTSGTFSLS